MLVSLPISLATYSLLLVSVLATPIPGKIKTGDVRMITPANTNGAVDNGDPQGANLHHPHVVVGKVPGTSEYQVVPITHANNDALKPHIPVTPGMHPLQGSASLAPVTAQGKDMHKPFPGHSLQNVKVGKDDINYLINGRKQVEASGQAIAAHEMAHDAHVDAHTAHSITRDAHYDHASQPHINLHEHQTHSAAAADHGLQADLHAVQAQVHAAAVAQHQHNYLNPIPGDKNAAHHTTQSTHDAHASRLQAESSAHHADAAHALLQAGAMHDTAAHAHSVAQNARASVGHHNVEGLHHAQGELHKNYAHQERQHALAHQPSNNNKPDPGHSIQKAGHSFDHAVHSNNKAVDSMHKAHATAHPAPPAHPAQKHK